MRELSGQREGRCAAHAGLVNLPQQAQGLCREAIDPYAMVNPDMITLRLMNFDVIQYARLLTMLMSTAQLTGEKRRNAGDQMRLHQLGRILVMLCGLQQLAHDFVCCREFRLL